MHEFINEIWFLVTAVIFTCLGFWWGFNYAVKSVSINIIDILVAEGYLRTKGHGENREILRVAEKDDQDSRKDS